MAIKKSQLYGSIWEACDALRGSMDASQYKDYVLLMLFIRYVSDKYGDRKDTDVVVPKGGSFSDLVALKGKKNIGEGINIVLSNLAKANELVGVIDKINFDDPEKFGQGKGMVDTLTKLVEIFENPDLNFSKNVAEGDDLLGDAYEYLMKQFAVESGKSKGQFYTPAEVSRVIAKLIGAEHAKGRIQTVYDPACGSGSLLLKVAAQSPNGLSIYGQEKDNQTAILAILNLWLHGEHYADIQKGQSTLSHPLFTEKDTGKLKTFDYVVANPPFSYKSWRSGFDPDNDKYDRFEEFGIPPNKNGDYAFLLHIIKSMKNTGKGACILPHGVLFRGNTEAGIRKNLVKLGFINGIIGLPANLFYGTGIPACIIIIDKEKAKDRKSIFMIDASKGFIKDGNKNKLREKDIRKIIDAWHGKLEIDKFSRIVSIQEIIKNEFNLNLPHYIDTQESEDIQNIEAHLRGGIPDEDIDALSQYWDICPTLEKSLFRPNGRDGFSEVKIPHDEIRKTVLSHAEFDVFRQSVMRVVKKWQTSETLYLKSIDSTNHPKAVIQKIADELLLVCVNLKLIEKYDIYQHLMNYWEEVMQDDAHIITVDGWKSGKEIIRLISEIKKKDGTFKKKEIAGLVGLEGRLVPPSLAIKTYFAKEQKEIDELNTTLEQIGVDMCALKDEHSGEEGLLFEVIDNDKIKKADVQRRAKEIKGSKDDIDEYRVLEKYLVLFEKETDAKKKIKETEEALEKKVLLKYSTFTEDEIKKLVVEHKWMDELTVRVLGEVDHLSQALAGRVKELAARYATTLPKLVVETGALTNKVDEHLKKMGFVW